LKETLDPRSPSSKEILPALDVILAVFRHQLGNSVNALKVTLDVLEQNFDSFDEGKKKEYLERALGILERQQVMVEAMKSYAHINAKEHRGIEFIPFWEHWLDGAKERLAGERIRLTHQTKCGSCTVVGDPLALRLALDELLGNAVEAGESGKDLHIDLTAEHQDDEIRITIRDNGCGIKEQELSKVFIPFFTTKPGKKGLGLSIALKLITQMGGRVEISPISEAGTRVNVSLDAGKGGHEKASQN
jgi:signal transduction histidine kinase